MSDVKALLAPFQVACRYCGAATGEQCRNDITGRPLRKAVAHPVRIRDADHGGEGDEL